MRQLCRTIVIKIREIREISRARLLTMDQIFNLINKGISLMSLIPLYESSLYQYLLMDFLDRYLLVVGPFGCSIFLSVPSVVDDFLVCFVCKGFFVQQSHSLRI